MDTTETGIISTTMDTTSMNKRRELPPLNVYVRIRPFISDELERGENQKLLDIIDPKHIAVKVYPTITNTIRNVQASYNEYEVQGYSKSNRRSLLFIGHSNIRSSMYTKGIIRTNSRTTNE